MSIDIVIGPAGPEEGIVGTAESVAGEKTRGVISRIVLPAGKIASV
jgi:hypothetical protein